MRSEIFDRLLLRNAVTSVLSAVGNLAVGAYVLIGAESTSKIVIATGLMGAGIALTTFVAQGLVYARREAEETGDIVDQIYQRLNARPLNYSRVKSLSEDTSWGETSKHPGYVPISEGAQTDLTGHAIVFYAGIAIGVAGIIVSAIGFGKDIYSATLTGSIIASVGFVSLACALISAKEANDAA